MKTELDEALVRDFPNLYRMRGSSPIHTAMCWGFECGDGWEPLIRELSEKLEKLIIETYPDVDDWETINYRTLCESDEEMEQKLKARPWIRKDPTWNEEEKTYKVNHNPRHRIHATQVKEKFGSLRFYMSAATDEMWKLIEEAERKSDEICENCGAPGKIRVKGGWYRTLCENHAKEHGYAQDNS